MLRRQFAIAVFAFIGALSGFGHPAVMQAYAGDQSFITSNPSRPVPPLSFEDEHGRSLALKDFKGHYVLLNLWATWCEPCADEMPALNALRKKLDLKKFEVIALAEDRDGLIAVKSFFKRQRIDNLPIFTDPSGQAPFILHARGLPTTLLIDPDGLEIARIQGQADWTEKNMVSFLQAQMGH